MRAPRLPLCTFAAICAFLSGLQAAAATDLTTLKLTGRWAKPPGGYAMGTAGGSPMIAITDKWMAVGAPFAGEEATRQGAVQIFNPATGAWVRKLLPPGPATTNMQFGASCAIHGNTLVVGQQAYPGTDPGLAHLYDLTTGKWLRTLRAPVTDDVTDNHFGVSVAITADRVIVGADRVGGQSGAVYVFDRKTGTFLAKLVPAGLTSGAQLGTSIAVEGSLMAIGAPGMDSARGAAYLYDLSTLTLIKKFQPAASTAGDHAGSKVAMHHGRLVLSAPDADGLAGRLFVIDLGDESERSLTASNGVALDRLGTSIALDHDTLIATSPFHAGTTGAAYLFDLASSAMNEFLQINPPDKQFFFGHSTAILGTTLCVATGNDSTLSSNSGAVYLMRPVTRPMSMTKLAARGDFAPGAPDIQFNKIGEAFINPDGEVAFASTLSGAGSNGGRDTAIFNSLKYNPLLSLVAKSRKPFGGVLAGTLSRPLINWTGRSFFMATLQGPGVTARNNTAIGTDNVATVGVWIRKGDPFGIGGDPEFETFTQVIQCRATDQMATTFTFRKGYAGTTNANDSGMVMFGTGGSDQAKEGFPSPIPLTNFGQIAPRIAGYFDRVTYAAAVATPPAFNQAIFQMKFQNTNQLVAQKGGMSGAGAATFSSFIGESSDIFDMILFRATLSSPATSANREGLWTHTTGGTTSLILRKGDVIPGQPIRKVARFIRFWQVAGQSLVLAQLSGAGVNAGNDLALLLYQTLPPFSGQWTVLMREGDAAPGCDPATIGTISRVEVDPAYGHYLVLVTLKGAPSTSNLALYRGYSFRSLTSTAHQSLRRPFLVLRKGQLFDNQPGRLKSISLPTSNVQVSGAGNVGLGTAIQEPTGNGTPSPVVIALDFENGVHQLMKGVP